MCTTQLRLDIYILYIHKLVSKELVVFIIAWNPSTLYSISNEASGDSSRLLILTLNNLGDWEFIEMFIALYMMYRTVISVCAEGTYTHIYI